MNYDPHEIELGDRLRDEMVDREWEDSYKRKLELEAAKRYIEDIKATGVHTCSNDCQRPMCKMRLELAAAREKIKTQNRLMKEILLECDEELNNLNLGKNAYIRSRISFCLQSLTQPTEP